MRNSIILVLVVILIAFSLCGCMPDEYPFKNANESVVSVELLYNVYAYGGYKGQPFEILCELDEASAKSFLDAVVKLETKKCLTPPPTGYGFHIARITYEDGDVELFGTRHIEYVKAGSEPTAVGAYYFEGDAFENLFMEYLDRADNKE